MTLTKAALLQPQGLTTTERNLLTLAGADTGRLIFNETTGNLEQWDGVKWVPVLNGGSALNGANLTGQVSGSLLAGTVNGALLTGTVQGSLLAGTVQGSLLAGTVDGSLLTGTVQGSLLAGTVQSNLLTGDIDGGVY
jgi:hypothetical protein